MSFRNKPLKPGLYLVSTPIGNADDVTLRALDVLARADCLAAEDTRIAKRLLAIHDIDLSGRPLLSYHEHNATRQHPRIMDHLEKGQSVALLSDAGTPLVSDPGYPLARKVIAQGYDMIPVPGASAALAALVVSGLSTDRFTFLGFLPSRGAARTSALHSISGLDTTMVIYESPRRLSDALTDMCMILGPDRQAAIAREMTKLHEEVRRGTLGSLARHYIDNPPRGECVIIVEGCGECEIPTDAVEALLGEALLESSLRDAVREVAETTGLDKRTIYGMAIRLRDNRS